MKQKKRIKWRCVLCLIIILAVLAVGSMLFINRKNTSFMAEFTRPELCYNESCIYVQVASTTYKKEQGLMYRRSLDENKWLLLDFKQPGIYGIAMRNVLIPLDIVRLDSNYTILYIKNMALPCTADPCPVFASPIPATYILEINWWLAEKIWLKEGKTFSLQK